MDDEPSTDDENVPAKMTVEPASGLRLAPLVSVTLPPKRRFIGTGLPPEVSGCSFTKAPFVAEKFPPIVESPPLGRLLAIVSDPLVKDNGAAQLRLRMLSLVAWLCVIVPMMALITTSSFAPGTEPVLQFDGCSVSPQMAHELT